MVGQILADLGAEVVKVESPDRFDLYRTRGLEHLRGKMDEDIRLESSLYFHSLNRNKTGLSLNLKSAEGRARLLELVAQADLLIENFTVGTMERMGLGRDVLKRANPGPSQPVDERAGQGLVGGAAPVLRPSAERACRRGES